MPSDQKPEFKREEHPDGSVTVTLVKPKKAPKPASKNAKGDNE